MGLLPVKINLKQQTEEKFFVLRSWKKQCYWLICFHLLTLKFAVGFLFLSLCLIIIVLMALKNTPNKQILWFLNALASLNFFNHPRKIFKAWLLLHCEHYPWILLSWGPELNLKHWYICFYNNVLLYQIVFLRVPWS